MGVLWCSAATLEPNELLDGEKGSQLIPCTGLASSTQSSIEVKTKPKSDIYVD